MNAFGKLDLEGVGMHTDDYRRGYIQGNRDGGPARVRDLLLGGPLALILLGLPFGMLFLLFWLDEHVPAVHAFMGILDRLAGFAGEDSGSVFELIVSIAISVSS